MRKAAVWLLCLSFAACSSQTGVTTDGGHDGGGDGGLGTVDGGNDGGVDAGIDGGADAGLSGCATACSAGLSCLAGKCAPTPCKSNADCASPLTCVSNYCGQAGGCSPPCGPSQVCVGQLCINDSPCGARQILCGSGASAFCANLAQDALNCGGCGLACAPGEVCTRGQCGASCLSTESHCGSLCTDTANDSANCGACGSACAAGQLCSGGVCAGACGGTYGATCGSGGAAYCAELQDDPYDCGGCGTQCGQGLLCSRGVCATSCLGIESNACGGVCADALTDPHNCGACGTRCGASQVCSGGLCTTGCGLPFSTCTQGSSPYCASLQEDTLNCGACGQSCGPGQVCSDGSCAENCAADDDSCGDLCTHLATDPQHCGSCGNACVAPQVCNGLGVCADTCAGGTGTCGGGSYCADLTNDHGNCGGCGTACNPGVACVVGICGGSVPDAGPDGGFDAGPVDAGFDAGPVDAGVDAGFDAGPVDAGPPPCDIDGGVYTPGTFNPDNGCLSCQPAVTPNAWSNADGTPCSLGGNVCQGGACVTGCVIAGTPVVPNARNPANDCQACVLSKSTSAWSSVLDGTNCDVGGNVCFQGRCQSGCLYAGTVYAPGTLYPINPCQYCVPTPGSGTWGNLPDNSNCSSASGTFTNFCQRGVCLTDTPANAPDARFGMPALLGPDGNDYVIGGIHSNFTLSAAVDVYHAATNSWSSGPPLLSPTFALAGTVANGQLYVFGGSTDGVHMTSAVDMLDVDGGQWQNISTMPTARGYLGVALGPDGLIYAIGGTPTDTAINVLPNGGETALGAVEAFDPVALTWATKAALPTPRFAPAVATGPDGLIYVIGGESASGISGAVEAFDTVTQKWITGLPALPTPRAYSGVTVGSDGLIYVISGWNGVCSNAAGFLLTVEAFDTTSQAWTSVPQVPFNPNSGGTQGGRMAAPAAPGSDGRIYYFEGNDGCGNGNPGYPWEAFSVVDAFSPTAQLWWN